MTRELNLSLAPLSRRHLLVSLAALPLVGAVLAACGDDSVKSADTAAPGDTTPGTTPGGTEPGSTEPLPSGLQYATGPDDVVLRIDNGIGGFTTPQFSFGAQPMLLVMGDGTVYQPGAVPAIYPPPLLPAVGVSKIDGASITKLLEAAQAANLLGEIPDYTQGKPNVTDVGSTIVTLNVNGSTFVHDAYALGLEEGSGSPATPERAALQAFVNNVSNLSGLLGADAVSFLGGTELVKEFAIAAMPVDLANYAEEPKPTVASWPTDITLDLASVSEGKGCKVLASGEIIDFLTPLNQLSFFTQGDVTYLLLVRAQLPGSPVC